MNNHVEGHLGELHGALETFSKVDARITSKRLSRTILLGDGFNLPLVRIANFRVQHAPHPQ